MPRPLPWSWPGFVATILALSVGGAFVAAMIGATLQHETISGQGAALLNTLGGGLIAVLSLWIGGQTEAARNAHDREITMSTETPDRTPDPDATPDPQVQPGVGPDVPPNPLDPGGADDVSVDATTRIR